MKIRDIIVEGIRDPEFKSWFGNSAVVDFQGKPLIVYHGGSYPSAGREFKGDTWFTIHVRDAYEYAKRDGSNVTSAYLSVQNPYVLKDGEDIYSVLGRVRGGSEYDGVYDPEIGDWVVWTSHQIRPIKTRRVSESIAENSNNTTTLNQLYNGNYPEQDEQLWNWVGLVDLDKPLNINRMSAQMLRSMLETQYHVDSYDDLVERLDADRRKLLKRYMNDQQLSNSIIVLCNDRVIDGNHRALAAALRGSGIRYVDVADLDNQQLDESSQSNDAAFIGYLSPDGKFECYSQSEAARVDYHHSMIVQDLDAYNAEGGLTFVRYDAEPLITIKGTPAIDPYDRRSAPMISKLARKIMQCGADPDLPIGIDNMGFKRTEAPYQGKQIGSLRSWAQRNVGIDEAVLDPRGAGSTPYGVDIDYFGLRVQMRPSTFRKLALPLTPATTSKTLGPYMQRGGAVAHPMLEFEMPDGWLSGDFSEPARIVDHEGRNRMKHWIRLHGDDPIQINMIPRGGLRRKHITPQMIQQLSAGMIGQRGDYVDGPLFEPSTALEESTASNAQINIQAHREGPVVWIDYFEVSPKRRGVGSAAYRKWEQKLPQSITTIKLVASDAGEGPSHQFWDQMGFEYVYPDDNEGPIEMIKHLQRKPMVALEESTDYRGSHTAPDRTNGAPLHDLETAFPGIYGPHALQYYKTGGNDADDRVTLNKIQRLHNKPRAGVQVYRAVPRGVRTINPGDWVAINKNYAVEHGAGQLRNAYRILTKIVSARDLYNNGDSIQEFGYDPGDQTT